MAAAGSAAPISEAASAPVPISETASAPVPISEAAPAPVPISEAASAPVPNSAPVIESTPASETTPQPIEQAIATQEKSLPPTTEAPTLNLTEPVAEPAVAPPANEATAPPEPAPPSTALVATNPPTASKERKRRRLPPLPKLPPLPLFDNLPKLRELPLLSKLPDRLKLPELLQQWRWQFQSDNDALLAQQQEDPLALARSTLEHLVNDRRIPSEVREALAEDYRQVERMLEKIEHGDIHIAVFGRVSVGKSAMCNALLGSEQFAVSALHGETKASQAGHWQAFQSDRVFIIDTPGIDEVDGDQREALARQVAGRADLVLYVVDSDITQLELAALRSLADQQRPLLLVLNKADRYTARQRKQLLASLRNHALPLVEPRNVVSAAAAPAEQLILRVDMEGNEEEAYRQPPQDINSVRDRLWHILESEGKQLAALNAALFAGQLSDQVSERIMAARHEMAAPVIRSYSVGKGVAVALTPIPLADLFAAAAVDVSMVLALSRLYQIPMTRNRASRLIRTIGVQMAAIWGTEWSLNLLSSALKFGTGGFSTAVTGVAQGSVAYFSTFVVGHAAERYLAQGMSWGSGGPKRVVREILAGLDRDSIVSQAKEDILNRLRTN